MQNYSDPLLKDFRNFLWTVWQFLALPAPTPVQYDIALFLQHGPKRQIIEAFRGVGKSWITSAYVLWELLRNPESKFLIVSASKDRADAFSSFTQRLLMEMPELQKLYSKKIRRFSMVSFDIATCRPAHAPSVKSVGVFGQMTGSRATHIIADDVEVLNNSDTEDKREKLIKTVGEFEAILVPEGKPRITYLGTPQTESSMYNKMRGKGYVCRIWPARYPDEKQREVYAGALAPKLEEELMNDPSLVGEPTDKLRFHEQDLVEREASYGRSGFALQFMLDTSLSDAERYPLKLADLIIAGINTVKAPINIAWSSKSDLQIKEFPNVGLTGDKWYRPMYVDEKWAEYEGSAMFIDPSGRGADETSYAVVKQLHGNLFVTAAGSVSGGYDNPSLVGLAKVAQTHKVHVVIVESNFGDGMFNNIFRPVLDKFHPCALEEVRHNIQKEARIIDTLEPVMNQHRLVFDEQVVRDDLKYVASKDTSKEDSAKFSLFYQMTHITKDRGALRHDDRLDALAGAVAYWTESMGRDQERAVEEHEEALLDAELDKLREHFFGKHGRPDSLLTQSVGTRVSKITLNRNNI